MTGVLGGLLAIAFMKSMVFSIAWVSRSTIPLFFASMIGGLLLGLMALELPHVIGIGDEVIHDTFARVFPLGLLWR